MAKIVLASGSPRRQELLRRMGITDFTVRVPEVEEYFPAGLTPEETVCYISREKSQAVASDADEIVITADTMVFLDDKKLGKPADEAEALQMLTALQGRRHTVCTGVTVRQDEGERAGPEGVDQALGEVGHGGGKARHGAGVGQVHDQRVVGGPALGGKDGAHRRIAAGVGRQAVHRLGGQADQFARRQGIGGAGDGIGLGAVKNHGW